MPEEKTVVIHVYHQKTGNMWSAVAIDDEKIWATTFTNSEKEALKQVLESLPYKKPFQVEEKPNPLSGKIFDAIESVLSGKDVSLSFQFERSHLSKYAQKILLDCLAQVPVGYVTTYKALSKTAGGGPRAVGQIMASNPFAPLIPCHRVIKSDFSSGGFGGGFGVGVKVKRSLLQREDRGFKKPSQAKTPYGLLDLFPVGVLRKD